LLNYFYEEKNKKKLSINSDEIFLCVVELGGISVVYNYSRLMLDPERFRNSNSQLFEEIKTRVLHLAYTTWDMQEFAIDFGMSKKDPPFVWNNEEREKLKAELDAIFFMMYGYHRKEVEYVLNTFKTLKNRELREYGEYRTKHFVLEAYDKFNSDPELGPLFRLEGVDLEKLKSE